MKTKEAGVNQEDIEDVLERLKEAEETLQAIRTGEVDALIVEGPDGSQVFTLRGAELPYRLLVEEMGEGAGTLLPDGTILYCNMRLAEMLHTPLQKLIGSSIYEVVGERDRAALQHLIEKAMHHATGEELGRGDQGGINRQSIELGLLSLGSSEETTGEENRPVIPTYVSASTLNIDEELAVCLVITDLTQQKRNEELAEAANRKVIEEQLKANKLESIGILAGGLAHDINNSLTAISGNIAMAELAAAGNEPLVRRLAEAELACLRARDVTQQLLTFAKGGLPVKKTVVSIGGLLQQWASFASAGSNTACEFEIAEDLEPVDIDEGQISRLISNLLINAQQSMPQGGLVTVRAENIKLTPEQIRIEALPLEPGRYIRVSIQDQGIGIPKDHLSKIFDPYFTTKQTGSGLGLASAYSIVKSHGGYITVASGPGVGSTFHVILPSSGADLAALSPKKIGRATSALRVLIMDDNEPVREVTGAILKQAGGHKVFYAEHGEEAIKLYKKAIAKGSPFDVVIMDLTIAGGLGGKETVQQLLEVDPKARVIVFSGYSTDPIMANYRKYGFSGVLQKPFSADELLREVQRVAQVG